MSEVAETSTPHATRAAGGAEAPPRRTILGALEILGAAACFSAIPIFTVLATERGGASLETVLAGRYLLAALALLAIARATVRRSLAPGTLWRMTILGGLGQAAVAFLALSALEFLPASTMVFLFYTYPAWVAVIEAVRRTDALTGRRLLALALALGGIWALVGSPWSGSLHPIGITLTLASALVYAFYIPFIGTLQREAGPVVASMWVSVGAAGIFLLAGAVTGRLTALPTALAWFGTAGLAIVSTALAFILFLRGLSLLGSVRTAIVSTAEPFFVTVLGMLVLNEPPTGATLVGGGLVAGAVVLIATGRR
jgi:drug/metabolite transporter (DMT)-like permease